MCSSSEPIAAEESSAEPTPAGWPAPSPAGDRAATGGESAGRGATPLRVGVLLDSKRQPGWRRRVLEALADGPEARLVLVAVARRGPQGDSPRPATERLYRALDRRLLGRGFDATDRAELAELPADCAILEIGPLGGRTTAELSATVVDRIAAQNLDVVVCLGVEPAPEQVALLARLGAFAYRFGREGADTPGVLEVLAGEPMTEAALIALADRPGATPRVVYRSRLRTDRLSHRRHVQHVGGVAAEFVGRALRAVVGGTSAPAGGGEADSTTARPAPTDAELARKLAGFGGRLAGEALRRLAFRDRWTIAYTPRPVPEDRPIPDLSMLRVLDPPPGHFWADPFPWEEDGRLYILFEDYVDATGRGRLSAIEVDERGVAGGPWTVLEGPDHLSYPFVFRHDGELFLMPESSARGTLELHRCVEFPGRWELDRVLFEGLRIADATLAEHDGRWWLFANLAAPGAVYDYEELHLFHADDPRGPWTPHRRNPVKSDIRSARPAGRLFRRGDAWYRPAQNCLLGYGHSITLNRIVCWDVDGYEEEVAGTILPDWSPGVDRIHTLNFCRGRVVVDARIARPRLASPLRRFR